MSTGSFPGVKCGWGVLLTTHHLLVPRLCKSRAVPLPTLWATPGLYRGHFTFFYILHFSSTQYQSISIIHDVIQGGGSEGVNKVRVLIMNCDTPATTAECALLRHSLATEFAVRRDAVKNTFLNTF